MTYALVDFIKEFGEGSLDICPKCSQSVLFKAGEYQYGHPLDAVYCPCGYMDFRANVVMDIPPNIFWDSGSARIRNRDAARANGKLCKNGRRMAA
jgi:hypothetical protein